MRGETVPKAAAISMVNRTLKDDGHSPSARECVEIVDALAAADGNDRVLNFTALEFWTVADRVMYPRTCECESASERADDTVPAKAPAEDYSGVVVQDRDGDFWKSNGFKWRFYSSREKLNRDECVSHRDILPEMYGPYVRVESLDSEGDDLDPFTTCLLIDTFQLVLRNSDVSILDRFMARAAIETAKMSLPDGAMEAYRDAKAAW
ncbi:hypothetical protein ACKFRL_07825 [Corynebacterium marquesiae]|uniref:hypothetical protein n=1 Tax=Corynebacterium marquesiae TaxID=2913503 RepID=UPI0038D112B0